MTKHSTGRANETMRELSTEELAMVGGATSFDDALKRVRDANRRAVTRAMNNLRRIRKIRRR